MNEVEIFEIKKQTANEIYQEIISTCDLYNCLMADKLCYKIHVEDLAKIIKKYN